MTPADFFHELVQSVERLQLTMRGFDLRGNLTIGIRDRRNAMALREIGAMAAKDGLVIRDPAHRLDARWLFTLRNVEFRDLSVDPPLRTVVVKAEAAMAFLFPGAVHTKEKNEHLKALEHAIAELARLSGREGE